VPPFKHFNTGVYIIRNVLNGKFYIGSAAKSLKHRKRSHFQTLRGGHHHNRHLQAAWNKYGPVFEFSVLEYCSPSSCISREQFWIDKTEATVKGYNICPTAGSALGRKPTEEFCKTVSEKLRGRKQPPELVARLSAIRKGKLSVRQAEALQRARAARQAIGYTDTFKRNLSIALTGRSHSEQTKAILAEKSKGNKNACGKRSEASRNKMREARLKFLRKQNEQAERDTGKGQA